MAKLIVNESYAHNLAKMLLATWLTEVENEVPENHKHGKFCGLTWKKNYGIYVELPFYETSHPYYFELSKYIKPYHEINFSDRSTWYDNGDLGQILFVPDITIFSCGRVAYMIEIVHKSPISENKKQKINNFFKRHHEGLPEVLTINAYSILCNTSRTTTLNFQNVVF